MCRRGQTPAQRPLLSRRSLHLIRNRPHLIRSQTRSQTQSRNLTTMMMTMTKTTTMTGKTTTAPGTGSISLTETTPTTVTRMTITGSGMLTTGMMTMTDELIKRLRTSWDTQRSIMLQTDAWMSERHLAADHIEALTAQLQVSNELGRALEEDAGQLRADNARLREAAAEVLRISDRDHVAWHRLRAEITKSRGVKPVSEKKWMDSYLTVGDEITNHINGAEICVSKIDRRDDPFFASVIRDKIVEATGLFPTLSAARKWCEARAALTGKEPSHE
jgi:hypothetical protein